jgi:hypothetical protein
MMRSEARRQFLIGGTCGLLLFLTFVPRNYGAPFLWPLLSGALVVYLAGRSQKFAAVGSGWQNDLLVTARTGTVAAVVYILISVAWFYGMSGRGPFSIAFAPEHYIELGFAKVLMTNVLILGLLLVPLVTIIGGVAAGFLLRARERKSDEGKSSPVPRGIAR